VRSTKNKGEGPLATREAEEFGKAHYFNKKNQYCQIVRGGHKRQGSPGLWITPPGRLESRFRTRAT
jgi:hypothetical protein